MALPTAISRLLLILASVAWAGSACAIVCNSNGSGGPLNWNATGTWTCGHVPLSSDDVTITDNDVVNVNIAGAVAQSLTIQAGGNDTFLIFNAGSSLTVTNNVAVQAPTANNATKEITLGTATLTVTKGNVTVAGGNNNNTTSQITITSGTLAVTTGSVTVTGGNNNGSVSQITVTSGALTVSAGNVAVTAGAGGTSTASLAVTTGAININTGTLNVNGGTGGSAVASVLVNSTGSLTVQGNATVTGGTAANRNALLSVATGLITINGGLTLASSFAATSTASITNAAGRITVNGAAGVTNGDTMTVGAGTFRATNAAATYTNSNAAIVANTTVSTGTLNVTGNLTNATGDTLTVSSTGNITVGGTLSNSATITLTTTGTVNANGTFTNSGTFTNTASGNLNLGGNATVNGTFNRGTGTVTCNGTAVQNLSGTALTAAGLNNFTMNNTAGVATTGVTLGNDITVNGTLTFTSGKITTGANNVIIATAGTIATPGSTSYVVGNFQKAYAAGNLSYAGADFPVGDASNYTPVDVTAGTTTSAGTLTISTLTPDHPQVSTPIASTGIDGAKSVNRYWRLNNSGLTIGTAISATFTFVAGDLDPGPPNTGNFIVERYDGTNWNPTTLAAANPLNTQASNITPLAVGNNDFAIGEPFAGVTAVPGLYNVFETATPAGSILGKIQTKVSGTGFSVDVVHINPAKTGVLAGAITVEVRLLNSSSGGALDVNGCNAGWGLIQAAPNFNIPASGRGTIPAVTVPDSYKSVRFQVRSPVGGPYTQTGCSGDLFAIRPQSVTITAHDATWQTAGTSRNLNNTGSSGGMVHAASTSAASTPRPFTLRATPVPATAVSYDGSPTVVAGFPTCGALCTTVGGLSFTAGSWTSAGSGVRENATAHYADVGTFNLQLEDSAYALVDAVDGSSAATRTIPATATVTIGRFVPDRMQFTTPNTPALQTFGSSCASRSFTYIGQPFWYATLASATLQAVNANAVVTTNYRGALFKLANTDFTETYSNNSVGPALSCKLSSNWATTCTSANAPPSLTAGNGTGTYTAAATGSVLIYTRDTVTPIVPYTANISLSVTATDSTENGQVGNPGNGATPPLTTASALVFNGTGSGIAFDSLSEFRYGRLRMLNGSGPTTVDGPVTLRAEYYASAATQFTTNTADNCTALIPKNFVLFGHQPSLTTANMVSPTGATDGNVSVSGTFAVGIANLKLLKPNPAVTTPGSVKVCLDLDSAAGVGDTSCQAATPANKSFLQGPWSGSSNQDKDPAAQVNLGVFGSQPKNFIYFRENY